MVWKPKEKELTEEEAIALAKKELAPFWFGSPPLFAGVKRGQEVSIHPLDPGFNSSARMIFFLDPTDLSGETALHFAREFYRRYHPHELEMLLVIQPSFPFLREAAVVESLIRFHQIPFPVVLDTEMLLATAFRATELPKVLLVHERRVFCEVSGENWVHETEQKVQSFLRSRDPGLPLLPFYSPSQALHKMTVRRDLGQGKGTLFPAPGFTGRVGNFSSASFPASRPAKLPLASKELHLAGTWIQDGDRIATSDPQAELGFLSPTPEIAVVAQSLAKVSEAAKLAIEINDIPVYDKFAGTDVMYDDDGQSVIKVEGPQLYHALTRLDAKNRQVIFRFPHADRAAIAIYGLRFGEHLNAP